jgi:hypothetical protein
MSEPISFERRSGTQPQTNGYLNEWEYVIRIGGTEAGIALNLTEAHLALAHYYTRDRITPAHERQPCPLCRGSRP